MGVRAGGGGGAGVGGGGGAVIISLGNVHAALQVQVFSILNVRFSL